MTCLVQYNHIYNADGCAYLTALRDTMVRNGNHHNWARQPGKGGASGLYIDNYNHNYIFHHNMV